jgi:uncharacterized membrane protein YecN with MAPEG domain
MIAPLYAAILALLFVALSLRTVLLRRKFRIAVAHAENESQVKERYMFRTVGLALTIGVIVATSIDLIARWAVLP